MSEKIKTVLENWGRTKWKNGSRIEIRSYTPPPLREPRPQLEHYDEIEIMPQDIWDGARAQSEG